jgi:hypothetical protein
MRLLKIGTFFFLTAYLSVASAQEQTVEEKKTEEKTSRVEISSFKDPELRSYAQMLKGMRAYNEKHALAPDSELYFILIPKTNSVSVQGLTMRLASDENSIRIPVDSSGQFKLPLIETTNDDEYDLILNKPKGQFLIRPYVKSANLPEDTKRLGDFRLECQVRWAIEKQDVSFVFKSYVKLLAFGDPCTARTIDVGFYAPDGIEAIALDTPKTKFSYKVKPYERFSLPLWDKEISDAELVKYQRALPAIIKEEN